MISFCLIVRNEEKYIQRCLESLSHFDDEIIVVDTGSTDRTIEICNSFPNAKVYEHKWESDFSLARNQSLKYATHDWIVWFDADMYWQDISQLQGLREFLTQLDDSFDSVSINLYDVPSHSTVSTCRVFRNHLGISFTRNVHEVPSVENTITAPFTFYHDRPDKSSDQYPEYLNTQSNDGDYTSLAYKATYCFHNKDMDGLFDLLKELRKHKKREFFYFYLAGKYAMEKGRYGFAVRFLSLALSYSPLDPRVYVDLGDCWSEIGNLLIAKTYYQHTLNLSDEPRKVGLGNTAVNKYLYDVIPMSNLGLIYSKIGNFGKAVEWTQKAIDIDPSSPYAPTLQKNLAIMQNKKQSNSNSVGKHTPAVQPLPNTVTVVVPTMGSRLDIFGKTLGELLNTSTVKEVVIIDNSDNEVISAWIDGEGFDRSKIRLIRHVDGNMGVNPAWNEGLACTTTPYYLLLNDDVLCRREVVDACAQSLDTSSDLSILSAVTDTSLSPDQYFSVPFNNICIQPYHASEHMVDIDGSKVFFSYGWFIFGRTCEWEPIPEKLKIYFGDNYIYYKALESGRNIGQIISHGIRHYTSSTIGLDQDRYNHILNSELSHYKRLVDEKVITTNNKD